MSLRYVFLVDESWLVAICHIPKASEESPTSTGCVRARTHTHTHTGTYTGTHTGTHTHTLSLTHTHTHTHTHTQEDRYLQNVAFKCKASVSSKRFYVSVTVNGFKTS